MPPTVGTVRGVAQTALGRSVVGQGSRYESNTCSLCAASAAAAGRSSTRFRSTLWPAAQSGNTCLHLASMSNLVGVANFLLAKGADIDARTLVSSSRQPGSRPQDAQVTHRHGEQAFVVCVQRPGFGSPQNGETPLILATHSHHHEFVALMTSLGADTECQVKVRPQQSQRQCDAPHDSPWEYARVAVLSQLVPAGIAGRPDCARGGCRPAGRGSVPHAHQGGSQRRCS